MTQKILLIEDEMAISESVAYMLQTEGYEVLTAEDGITGLELARDKSPDLIILDLMLPRLSGIEICQTLRQESNVPIIMLTAKTDEVDRIVGLELGADDYVTKPFSLRELVARVKAVLRRPRNTDQEFNGTKLKAGSFVVDLLRRQVIVFDRQVHLPLKQFELLCTMLEHKDEVLTREYLLQTIWNSDATFDTGTLDVHIRWLREKIERDPSNPKHIRTVRGVGYKFVSETKEHPI